MYLISNHNVIKIESEMDRLGMLANMQILEEFVTCMRPSKLQFDKLQLWARVINLPFHLRNETQGEAIAKQIYTKASSIQLDPMGAS